MAEPDTKGSEDPERYVRRSLARMESGYRELALRALADWIAIGIRAPELYKPIAGLQKPSWGQWNGILNSLRSARKAALDSATDEMRARIDAAAELTAVLGLLDRKADRVLVERLLPLASLVHVSLGGSPRLGQLLSLAITLRNRIAHDSPTELGWWSDVAAATRALFDLWGSPSFLPQIESEPPKPWFDVRPDGVWTFNGLTSDLHAIFVSGEGRSVADVDAGVKVVEALKSLFGRSDAQEKDFRAILSRLAPEEIRGVLLGDFLVGAPVAVGGFATVHRGRQLSTGRPVAVKIPHLGLGAEARQRFYLEAEVLSRFNHPNIVSIVGFGEDAWSAPREISLDSVPWFDELRRGPSLRQYLAMEWLDGNTVDHWCGSSGERVAPSVAIEWFAEAAAAMELVHAAGFLHRDLKPSNLMITPEGTLKILDFGIARARDESRSAGLTTEGEAPGSIAYMAPEQLRSVTAEAEVGPRADVYGLCAALYEVLTGSFLFDHGTTSVDVIRKRKLEEERPLPARRLVRDLPWEIETILLAGLEPSPADRYESMRALERDLRHVLAFEPIEKARTPWARRVRLAYRRNRTVFRLATLVAVTVTVSLFVVVTLWQRAERASTIAEQRALVAHAREQLLLGAREASVAYALAAYATNEGGSGVGDSSDLLAMSATRSLSLFFTPHDDVVAGVAVASDGSFAISASRDGAIRKWDTATGSLQASWNFERRAVDAMGLLRESRRVVFALGDGSIRTSDVDGRNRSVTTRLPVRTTALSISPDGRRALSVGHDGRVRVFSFASPTTVMTIEPREANESDGHEARSASFAPDGSAIVVGTLDGNLIGFGGDGSPRPAIDIRTGRVRSLVASRARSTVFASGRAEIVGWDLTLRRRIGPTIAASGLLASSEDGRFLAVGSDVGDAYLFDVESGVALSILSRAAAQEITSIATSGDASTVVLGASDGTVRVWHPTHVRSRVVYRSFEGPLQDFVRIAPRTVVAVGIGGDGVALDLDTGATRAHFPVDLGSDTLAVATTSNGARVFTGGSSAAVRVWRGRDFVEEHSGPSTAAVITSIRVSPDDRHLAVGDTSGNATLYALPGLGEGRSIARSAGDVWDLAFSPDGTRLAVATANSQCLLVDVSSGSEERIAEMLGIVTALAFSPDGTRLALGSRTGSVAVWDLRARRLEWSRRVHSDLVGTVAFSPDGLRIASGSSDSDIRLWGVDGGALLGTLGEHRDAVRRVSFLSARELLSVSHDGTVRLWNLDGMDEAGLLATAMSETNLRVCRDSLDVVPVVPFAAARTMFAPSSSCASRPRRAVGAPMEASR